MRLGTGRPALGLSFVLAMAGSTLVASLLAGQQAAPDEEARGLVEPIAATVYKAAWPTATFERFALSRVNRTAGGQDVIVRLEGISAFGGGTLWMELALEFRGGRMTDLAVRRHNAVLAKPFETSQAVGRLLVDVGEEMAEQARLRRILAEHRNAPADRRAAGDLMGTWRGGNSIVTYTSAGAWTLRRDDGVAARGVWTLRNDTLTWHYHGGATLRFFVLELDGSEQAIRNLSSGDVWRARRTGAG